MLAAGFCYCSWLLLAAAGCCWLAAGWLLAGCWLLAAGC
jgi:hypothetical protein